MKLFDCTTYYDEELIIDLRLNMLDHYVDKFIICEAKFSHSGRKKELNFDLRKFSKFKKKIEYIVVENEPKDLVYEDDGNKKESHLNWRSNSVKRIAFQRNKLLDVVNEIASENDYIIFSDNDEIPNLDLFDTKNSKSKITIFEQDLFYYKFNLLCDRIKWYGTRIIKKKDLINFEWLRQVKPKKYPFYRIDTFLKNDRYMNVNIVKNGGWHFTRMISPEEIHKKELDTEHHDEYRASKKTPEMIKDFIKRRVIDHDHLADSRENKFGKEFPLKQLDINEIPKYIRENQIKYSNWLDFN